MSKGRKVYRRSKYTHKRKITRALYISLFIIVIAALIFFGYSIGAPILDFITNKNPKDVQTEPWTPPPSDTTSSSSVSDTSVSETETAISEITSNETELSAFTLPSQALISTDSLNAALENAKAKGYTSAIVILKEQGGKFYYATDSKFAATAENIVQSKLTAKQIVSAINSSGLKPIAKISVLNDNNRYGANRDGSYKIASDNSTWLDNSPANGGKPWLSPFLADTQEYMGFLADEISGAGFETIICDDIMFPEFRNSDLNYIGKSVKSNTRYKALINIVNIIKDASKNNNCSVILEINASDIISNKAEVLKPSELTDITLAVNYSPAQISYSAADNATTDFSKMNISEKTTAVFSDIKSKTGDLPIIPYINASAMTESELTDTLNALKNLGYSSYLYY